MSQDRPLNAPEGQTTPAEEAPRLQDTAEREALPLPVPSGEDPESGPGTPPAEPPPSPEPASGPFTGLGESPSAPAHPELLVGGAFLGGLAVALMLRRLGS